MRRSNLLIMLGLMVNSPTQTGEGLLNRKGLPAEPPGERQSTVSGFVAPLKRGEADLLISQGLLYKFPRRVGELALNLKDLLTVFPASLKRSFENEPVLRASLLVRIAPNSVILCQNEAEYDRKVTFFRDRFYQKVVSPRLV
jgi:hypothetical protein